MIERAFEALERAGSRELDSGCDASLELRWRRSAEELLLRVGAWQQLLTRRGVQPGDRVAIDVSRGPELLPAHLAVLGSGACAVPVNPALASAERERILERAGLRTLLADADSPDRGAAARLGALDPERPALLIFTSGTTGEPKGVPLSLANLEANLADLAQTWQLSADDRLLHVLPAHHVHGLVLALYGSARLAMPHVLLPRFDAATALRAIAQFQIRLFMGVPTMYHRMNACEGEFDTRRVRLFISGSAPLSKRDFAAFEERFDHRPLERYGLSETLIVSSNPLDGERRAGSVGLPLPQTELRMADDGEIEVAGPMVMRGYWNADELSAEAFNGRFFRTGDLGAFDEAGYLVISGRKKELIIVGGSNVLPGEVEFGLGGVDGIDELAVAGLPDPDRGEVVGVFVVAEAGADTAAIESGLQASGDANLAPYKRPHRVIFVPELPRNQMGKIDRKQLSELG